MRGKLKKLRSHSESEGKCSGIPYRYCMRGAQRSPVLPKGDGEHTTIHLGHSIAQDGNDSTRMKCMLRSMIGSTLLCGLVLVFDGEADHVLHQPQ
jgi:hypothetical protein